MAKQYPYGASEILDESDGETQLERRPKKLRRVLASAAVIMGFLFAVTGITLFIEKRDTHELIAMILYAIALLLPGTWWFYCTAKDDKAIEAYNEAIKTREETVPFLTAEHAAVLRGLGTLDKPKPVKRWWLPITLICIGLVATAGVLYPTPNDGEEHSSASTADK